MLCATLKRATWTGLSCFFSFRLSPNAQLDQLWVHKAPTVYSCFFHCPSPHPQPSVPHPHAQGQSSLFACWCLKSMLRVFGRLFWLCFEFTHLDVTPTHLLYSETNLKIRQGKPETSMMVSSQDALRLEGLIRSELPNSSLYTFEGVLELKDGRVVPLDPNQLLLRVL